jgi:hypothetical protein
MKTPSSKEKKKKKKKKKSWGKQFRKETQYLSIKQKNAKLKKTKRKTTNRETHTQTCKRANLSRESMNLQHCLCFVLRLQKEIGKRN